MATSEQTLHRLTNAGLLVDSAGRRPDVSFTMVAEARGYRESVALSKMSPAEREKYLEYQERVVETE